MGSEGMTMNVPINKSDRPVAACGRVLQWVGPQMVSGFVASAAGMVAKKDWLTKAGLVAFFSGLLICGAANVVALGGSFIATLRHLGRHELIKEAREGPIPWIMMTLIFLMYAM